MRRTAAIRRFTLSEFLVAFGMMTLMSAVAISGFLFILATQKRIEMQSDLDMSLRLALESLKQDVRLSATDRMLFYPPGPGSYTAVKFPKAHPDSDTGLIRLDDRGRIVWDETVIYHVHETASGPVLRRTAISPRDASLTEEQRYEQFLDVIREGQSFASNSETVTLVSRPFRWEIDGTAAVFDAYSPDIGRRENRLLGTTLIGPGTHYLEFTVVGRNPSSTGYNLGLDTLIMSPSGLPREAEAQTVHSQSANTSHDIEYMPMGNWSGNHHFMFNANGEGDFFTFSMPSDCWIETNFAASGGFFDHTAAVYDTAFWPATFVVQLEPWPTAWSAASQTGEYATGVDMDMSGTAIRVLVKGAYLRQNLPNPWIEFAAPPEGRLHVTAAYIAENDSTASAATSRSGTPIPLAFGSPTGDPSILLHAGQKEWATVKHGYAMSIDDDTTYAVSFFIGPDNNHGAARYYRNVDSEAVDAYVIPADELPGTSVLTQSDWGELGAVPLNKVYGIGRISTPYAPDGAFTSRITDTRLERAKTATIVWDDRVPGDTGLAMRIRSGNRENLADAPAWETVDPIGSGDEFTLNRYVQFRAALRANSEANQTPKLTEVAVTWPGDPRVADIAATITTAPDHGIYELRINGWPLIQGVTVKAEVSGDIRLAGGGTRTLSSRATTELEPRNTGF